MTGMGVFDVQVTDLFNPDHKEDARRIVRHGLADVLDWLGEEVGPAPGVPSPIAELRGRTLLIARAFVPLVRVRVDMAQGGRYAIVEDKATRTTLATFTAPRR